MLIRLRIQYSYFFTYLKELKQNVTINKLSSVFKEILFGVLQCSVLDPMWFNVYLNDLFLRLNSLDPQNSANDNTFARACKNLTNLLDTL